MTTIDTGTGELLCELTDGVATVTLNKPHKRNALGDVLTPALRALLPTLEEDARCGAVVITGAGRAFCAGGDVSGMGARRRAEDTKPMSQEEALQAFVRQQETLTLRLHELSKPTIAALPGPAAGAGLSLALACDMRMMADSAFITTAFANVGLSGDYGGTWFLTHLVGPAIAKELYLTARRVPADECLKLGIANCVLPFDELKDAAHRSAMEIANGPSTALRYMKRNINAAVDADLKSNLVMEAEGMLDCRRTADHREAVQAFVEKRPPRFKGPG